MNKKRIVTALLLLVWLGLTVAPAAFAANGPNCAVCRNNICRMHKPANAHPSCHGEMAMGNTGCKWKASACNHESDPALFAFDGILPETSLSTGFVPSRLIQASIKRLSVIKLTMETPPPKRFVL